MHMHMRDPSNRSAELKYNSSMRCAVEVAFALAVKISTSYGLPWDPTRAALASKKEWRTGVAYWFNPHSGSLTCLFLIIHRRYLLPSDVHHSPRSEDFPEKAEIASEV
ncbi:hypothetical protein KC19_2G238100 [Ceratodon purpureus]|uniref:Uncharacterized protein n=1 Tax=Ceratodon purpureus TaxID=3225 RepID=A0A8T0IZG3_CERPU|nr:hypothetical protein KC19_2G238100 [Ceratodon purpureus]